MQIRQSSAGKFSKMNLPVSTDGIFSGAESPEQFMQIFVKRTDVGGICETVMSVTSKRHQESAVLELDFTRRDLYGTVPERKIPGMCEPRKRNPRNC